MELNALPITNICDYTKVVNDALSGRNSFRATTMPWYRGQDEFSWPLTPSLYRNELVRYEREILRDFKLASHMIIKKDFFGVDSEIEWVFLMQHYGLPTRLLDWTESSLIALYFAVRNYQNLNDAVVWMLDPWTLNDQEETLDYFSVPDETNPILDNYVLPPTHSYQRSILAEFPIAIRAKKNNNRILAQKGQFTIHGYNAKPLDTIVEEFYCRKYKPIYLRKIKISGEHKLRMLKELYVAGISDSVVFPEITGICNEIRFRHSNDFHRS